MATHITQVDGNGHTLLRVEGEMLLEDAVVLEKIAADLGSKAEGSLLIDLADLDFLDSESAVVLKRLQDSKDIEIVGMETFVQSAIDSVERSGRAVGD
jgi:anti-anti-sigma regulatory factor